MFNLSIGRSGGLKGVLRMFFVPVLGSLFSSALSTAFTLSAGAATASAAAVNVLPVVGSTITGATSALGSVVGAKVAAGVTAAGGSGITAAISNGIAANTATAVMNYKVADISKKMVR